MRMFDYSEIMADKQCAKPKPDRAAAREERLGRALRANLRRRKSQAKERQGQTREGDEPTGTPDT